MSKVTREYYTRSTDRIGFYTHDILRYDVSTHTYYTVDRFSKPIEDKIINNLEEGLKEQFKLFMLKEWGPRENEDGTVPSEHEVNRDIAELESIVNTKKNENSTDASAINKDGSVNMGEMSAEDIIEQSSIKDEWASGYFEDEQYNKNDDTSTSFSLGEFFDDDDLYS